MSALTWSFLVSVGINFIMFLIAYRNKSDKLTDISYAATFILLTWVAFFMNAHYNLYGFILTAMVIFWAVRIGGFLLMRVMKQGKDSRFDGIREDFLKFGRFWVGQGLTVWLLMIPSTWALTNGGKLSLLGIFGILVWVIGFILEATADVQKFIFSQNPANKNKWIAEGVWKYSRHPNYFGEILIWTGIYIFSMNGLVGYEKLLGLVSPIFIATLLLFVTGIPVLEKSADKRWGEDGEYRKYKNRTSILVPLPIKK